LKRKRKQVEKTQQTIQELDRLVWPEKSLAGVEEHLDNLFAWIPGKEFKTKRRRAMPDFIFKSIECSFRTPHHRANAR
jgi:hypothetical protein